MKSAELKFTRLEVVSIVVGVTLVARLLAIGCAKAAALYTARGDVRQAVRFSRLARGFARMSYMFGELEQDTEGSR